MIGIVYKNIKAIRGDNDLTQKQMAELLNVSVDYLLNQTNRKKGFDEL